VGGKAVANGSRVGDGTGLDQMLPTVRGARKSGAGEIKFDWLMKTRCVIARCGEMDVKKWWNTTGQLGPYGAKALARGFPRTHFFAQARSVFAVASHRCAQVFDPPDSVTIWKLTETIEDQFDGYWEAFLDDAAAWNEFFNELAAANTYGVPDLLKHFGLVDDQEIAQAASLKRSSEGKAVFVPGVFGAERSIVAALALAFSKSGDIVEHVDPIFFGDPKTAAFKALGLN
jgi:hypothetical protein